MSSFSNLDVLPEILKIFKVKNLVISNVIDKNLIEAIKSHNLNITLINMSDENSIDDNPLNVLPNLKNYDAIFIGGDANWFTVFNELNIIKKSNNEFPLVFICNNIFPNKRRDSYINPDIIPSKFRQKYVKELPICYNNEKINIVDGYYHACDENTPKNGVLTAIEDFLSMYPYIGIMKINFISEITILYQKIQINEKRIDIIKSIQNEENKDINSSDLLLENKLLISYINKYNLYNENVIDYEVEISKKNNIINDYENKLQIQGTEMEYKDGRIKYIESKLNLKDTQIKNIKSKLVNKDKTINNLENKLENVNNNLNKKENIFNKKINSLENQLTEKHDELNFLKSDFKEKEMQLDHFQQELDEKENYVINMENEITFLKNDLVQNEKNFKNQINIKNSNIQHKDNQLKIMQQDLNNTEQKLNSMQYSYTRQLSNFADKEYCISCFKEEISNNHLEIDYLRNNILIKKISSPFAYLYLIFKSNKNELSLNIKLYKALKNSKCFDIGFYLNENKDLIESKWCKYFSPELHYVCNGFNEERIFNKKYFKRNSKKDLLDYILKFDK